MKTLLHTARNHSLHMIDQPDGNPPVSVMGTEVVLVITEPKYAYDKGGDLVKSLDTETVRFISRPKSLRTIAKELNLWADENEALFGDLETPEDKDEGIFAGPGDGVDHVDVPENEIGENGRVDAVSEEQIDEHLGDDEWAGPTAEELLTQDVED